MNLQNINLKKLVAYSVFFLFIFLGIFLLGYFLSSLNPVSAASLVKEIEIKEGEGFGQIAADLESAGIVRSGIVFKAISLISGSAHKLKPGIYMLDVSKSAADILKAIVAGPEMEREVVIPEGFTLADIDKRLSDAGIITAGALISYNPEVLKNNYEFLKSPVKLEGYLFPDTYNFFIKSKPEEVAVKFLDNFRQKAWTLLMGKSYIAGKTILNPHQILIVASLVEKEVYFDEERAKVAGIIYKRLKMGMALQIDATITYAKCNGLIFYCENPAILKTETKFQSTYNTYLYKGLPPGPISNPGLKSIEAAINPETSDFLYYLSDPKTHKIIFSKTFEEHNENRARYLGV